MNYFDRESRNQKVIAGHLQEYQQMLSSLEEDLSIASPKKYIRLHESTLGKEELIAFNKAYLEGNITMGKYNETYERIATEKFDSKYCMSSNSGSSANLLGIEALVQTDLIKPGDKVLVPKLAWSTTIFPLIQCGLVPVYIDISFNDFNICIDDIIKQIDSHNPKALMLIHTYGNPCNMDIVTDICRTNEMLLIEDTCESMGATWKNKPVGSFGIVGTYSSYYSHHICTLEGGLTITNDFVLYEAIKSIRSHGWTRGLTDLNNHIYEEERFDPNFTFIFTGYNLRMPDPQAAMGIVQLTKLESFVSARNRAAQTYINMINADSLLSDWIKYPNVNTNAKSSWFGFPILIEKLDRHQIRQLREYLKNAGIETRPFLAGDFSKQPVNKRYKYLASDSNNISVFNESAMALPCHQSLSDEEISKIGYHLKHFIEEFK